MSAIDSNQYSNVLKYSQVLHDNFDAADKENAQGQKDQVLDQAELQALANSDNEQLREAANYFLDNPDAFDFVDGLLAEGDGFSKEELAKTKSGEAHGVHVKEALDAGMTYWVEHKGERLTIQKEGDSYKAVNADGQVVDENVEFDTAAPGFFKITNDHNRLATVASGESLYVGTSSTNPGNLLVLSGASDVQASSADDLIDQLTGQAGTVNIKDKPQGEAFDDWVQQQLNDGYTVEFEYENQTYTLKEVSGAYKAFKEGSSKPIDEGVQLNNEYAPDGWIEIGGVDGFEGDDRLYLGSPPGESSDETFFARGSLFVETSNASFNKETNTLEIDDSVPAPEPEVAPEPAPATPSPTPATPSPTSPSPTTAPATTTPAAGGNSGNGNSFEPPEKLEDFSAYLDENGWQGSNFLRLYRGSWASGPVTAEQKLFATLLFDGDYGFTQGNGDVTRNMTQESYDRLVQDFKTIQNSVSARTTTDQNSDANNAGFALNVIGIFHNFGNLQNAYDVGGLEVEIESFDQLAAASGDGDPDVITEDDLRAIVAEDSGFTQAAKAFAQRLLDDENLFKEVGRFDSGDISISEDDLQKIASHFASQLGLNIYENPGLQSRQNVDLTKLGEFLNSPTDVFAGNIQTWYAETLNGGNSVLLNLDGGWSLSIQSAGVGSKEPKVTLVSPDGSKLELTGQEVKAFFNDGDNEVDQSFKANNSFSIDAGSATVTIQYDENGQLSGVNVLGDGGQSFSADQSQLQEGGFSDEVATGQQASGSETNETLFFQDGGAEGETLWYINGDADESYNADTDFKLDLETARREGLFKAGWKGAEANQNLSFWSGSDNTEVKNAQALNIIYKNSEAIDDNADGVFTKAELQAALDAANQPGSEVPANVKAALEYLLDPSNEALFDDVAPKGGDGTTVKGFYLTFDDVPTGVDTTTISPLKERAGAGEDFLWKEPSGANKANSAHESAEIIYSNWNILFGEDTKEITKEDLEKLANDETLPQFVKDAAQALLDETLAADGQAVTEGDVSIYDDLDAGFGRLLGPDGTVEKKDIKTFVEEGLQASGQYSDWAVPAEGEQLPAASGVNQDYKLYVAVGILENNIDAITSRYTFGSVADLGIGFSLEHLNKVIADYENAADGSKPVPKEVYEAAVYLRDNYESLGTPGGGAVDFVFTDIKGDLEQRYLNEYGSDVPFGWVTTEGAVPGQGATESAADAAAVSILYDNKHMFNTNEQGELSLTDLKSIAENGEDSGIPNQVVWAAQRLVNKEQSDPAWFDNLDTSAGRFASDDAINLDYLVKYSEAAGGITEKADYKSSSLTDHGGVYGQSFSDELRFYSAVHLIKENGSIINTNGDNKFSNEELKAVYDDPDAPEALKEAIALVLNLNTSTGEPNDAPSTASDLWSQLQTRKDNDNSKTYLQHLDALVGSNLRTWIGNEDRFTGDRLKQILQIIYDNREILGIEGDISIDDLSLMVEKNPDGTYSGSAANGYEGIPPNVAQAIGELTHADWVTDDRFDFLKALDTGGLAGANHQSAIHFYEGQAENNTLELKTIAAVLGIEGSGADQATKGEIDQARNWFESEQYLSPHQAAYGVILKHFDFLDGLGGTNGQITWADLQNFDAYNEPNKQYSGEEYSDLTKVVNFLMNPNQDSGAETLFLLIAGPDKKISKEELNNYIANPDSVFDDVPQRNANASQDDQRKAAGQTMSWYAHIFDRDGDNHITKDELKKARDELRLYIKDLEENGYTPNSQILDHLDYLIDGDGRGHFDNIDEKGRGGLIASLNRDGKVDIKHLHEMYGPNADYVPPPERRSPPRAGRGGSNRPSPPPSDSSPPPRTGRGGGEPPSSPPPTTSPSPTRRSGR